MTHFFITGLPRSRTLWLASYLSWGRVACEHDLSLDFVDLDLEHNGSIYVGGLCDSLRSIGDGFSGDSDSGLLLCWEEIHRRIPSARWVLVRRDTSDVMRSMSALGLPTYGIDVAEEEMDRLERTVRPLVVAFEEIDARLTEIEEWIAPGVEYPAWRRSMLLRANIAVCDRVLVDIFEGTT